MGKKLYDIEIVRCFYGKCVQVEAENEEELSEKIEVILAEELDKGLSGIAEFEDNNIDYSIMDEHDIE